jgi:hypothetical protein
VPREFFEITPLIGVGLGGDDVKDSFALGVIIRVHLAVP